LILDLGNAEAVMPSSERIPYERLERGARVKALILEVRGETKGPQIVVSRSHPEFIRRLFELEVPELVEGVIEIRAIARDAGHRTKIAVASNDPNVDPVGACVGARGSRVRQVVNELRGEKVDIVEWRDDPRQFIAEALSPARVRQVIIDDENEEAVVVVPDHQLSLAIGKEGQNARLAARLSGYRIDIRSETEQAGGERPAPGEEGTAEEAAVTEEAEEAPETAEETPEGPAEPAGPTTAELVAAIGEARRGAAPPASASAPGEVSEVEAAPDAATPEATAETESDEEEDGDTPTDA
jgi:N utilization substance protein A